MGGVGPDRVVEVAMGMLFDDVERETRGCPCRGRVLKLIDYYRLKAVERRLRGLKRDLQVLALKALVAGALFGVGFAVGFYTLASLVAP